MNNVFLYADDYEIALNECDDPRHILVAIREVMHREVGDLDTIDADTFDGDHAAMWYYKRLCANVRAGEKKRQEKAEAKKQKQRFPQNGGGQKKVYFKDNRQNGYGYGYNNNYNRGTR